MYNVPKRTGMIGRGFAPKPLPNPIKPPQTPPPAASIPAPQPAPRPAPPMAPVAPIPNVREKPVRRY